MARQIDKYANIMSARVTTAGVATASAEIETGISLGTKTGILIDQIDYYADATVMADLGAGATGDVFHAGWFTQDPSLTPGFNYANSRLIHMQSNIRYDDGVAASGMHVAMPQTKQFFPPLIVAAPKMFFGCICTAAISAGIINSRIYFRYVDLTSQEYLELAESFVLMS